MSIYSFHLNKFAFGYVGIFFLVTADLVGKVLIILLEDEKILKFINEMFIVCNVLGIIPRDTLIKREMPNSSWRI